MIRISLQDGSQSPRQIWVELFQALGRHKLLVVMVYLLTVLSAYAYVQLLTERYLAEAQLLVKLGRQNVDGPVTAARGTVTTMGVREEEINSNISLLMSRSLVQETVDEIGTDVFESTLPQPETAMQALKYYLKLSVRWIKKQSKEALIALQIEKRLTPRETIVIYCQQNLTVERVKSSDVIAVRMILPNGDLAVQFTDILLRKYLERHVKARAPEVSEDFFGAQAEAHLKQITMLEQQLVELRDKSKLTLIDRQRDLLLTRLLGTREELDDSRNELKLLRQGQNPVREDGAGPPGSPIPEIIPTRVMTPIKELIVSLYLEKSRTIASEGEQAPSIKAIEEQIRRCESQLEQGLLALIKDREAEVAQIELRLAELNEGEIAVETLSRERLIAQRNYDACVIRREDGRISRELDRSQVANVTVLTAPVASEQPIYPRKRTIMLVSLAAGFVVAVGLVLAMEYFDDTVRTSTDLAVLPGWEILGQVRMSSSNGRSTPPATPVCTQVVRSGRSAK